MKDTELRYYTGTAEIRKNEDGTESRTIEGYAAVFDQYSHDLGWFKEKISRNAFDGVDFSDVVATMNHDFNMVMARTTNTLKLTIDSVGLRYSFEAPKTTAGNDLLENVRNGNISGSSFMFTVEKDMWTFNKDPNEVDEREVIKVGRLIELGPVVLPAYPQTSASAKRSYDEAVKALANNVGDECRGKIVRNKIKIIKIRNHENH